MAVGVSTLYFETDARDGFRESRFSKERRLEPQIAVGLLAAQFGFPLMVSVFASTGDQLCTNVSQLRFHEDDGQRTVTTVESDIALHEWSIPGPHTA
jgi:hypothetical protein